MSYFYNPNFLRQHPKCNFSVFFVPLQLALEDPVHSVSLQQFVYEKLKAQQAMMGDQGFGVLMETVDTELVRQLQEFLQGLWITYTILHYLTEPSPPVFENVPERLIICPTCGLIPPLPTATHALPYLYSDLALSTVSSSLSLVFGFLYIFFFYQDGV